MSKNQKRWSYASREKLLKTILNDCKELYPYPNDVVKRRHFVDEAKSKLPKLHKEIEEHNRNADKVNAKNVQDIRNLRSKISSKVRFGTEGEVQALAEKYVLNK